MPVGTSSSDLPVLLLFNLNPDWSAHEQEEVLEITSRLDKAIWSLGCQTTLAPVTNSDLDLLLARYDPHNYIVFNWCESIPGIPHSEWLVTKHLEQRGFAFTGAGSAAMALAQDKLRVKQLLDEFGIPTPQWKVFDCDSTCQWNRFPAIVKPSREHCSEGIDRNAVVKTEAELKDRVNYVLEEFRQPALVEDFIDGRELHLSLWGNNTIEMLPAAEMEFSSFGNERDRICSYEAKFVPESEQYQKIKTVLPAPLGNDELRSIERVCKTTYDLTGCRDYARIDMRIRDGDLYVIDVNPNADISPDTSTICAAELAGYSYAEFGGRILNLAALRYSIWEERIGQF
ncbi:MAG: ATP-grasp domain-containing protein [Dehalococcoidia bacterium]|nr:MAG: ATP-grasp domain-containing protein [Dehalococcoidia bacterium]